MNLRFVRLFVSVLLVGTLAFAQGDADQDVRALIERWNDLFNQGDYQAVVDLYTEDGIFSNPLGVFAGREAIREHFAGPAQVAGSTILPTIDEVEVFGDAAYGMGTYVHLAPDASVIMQGSFMLTTKRVDGEWKIQWQLVNMLLPEPEAAAP